MDPKVQRRRWELKLGFGSVEVNYSQRCHYTFIFPVGVQGFQDMFFEDSLGVEVCSIRSFSQVLEYQFLGGSVQFSLPMGFKVFLF